MGFGKWKKVVLRNRVLVVRLVLAVLVLFVLSPLIAKMLFNGSPYLVDSVKNNFMLFGTTVVVFIVLMFSGRRPEKSNYYVDAASVIIGLVLVFSSCLPLMNIGSLPLHTLSASADKGFDTDNLLDAGWIDLDSGRLLSFRPLNVRVPVVGVYLFNQDDILGKTFHVDNVANYHLILHASWQDRVVEIMHESGFDNNEFSPDNRVWLWVNSNKFDITKYFAAQDEYVGGWIRLMIGSRYLSSGLNNVSLMAETKEDIIRVSEIIDANTPESLSGDGIDNQNLLIFMQPDNKFNVLYKLGYLLKLLGLVLIIFGLTGLRVGRIRKYAKEIIFSFLLVNAFFYLSHLSKQYWVYLSKIVSLINQVVFVLIGVPSTLELGNLKAPVFNIHGFNVSISAPCSGISSLNYFMIAVVLMLVVNWREIDFKRALLVVPLGIIGMVLVNTLRVMALLLIGAYYSRDVALGIFHTSAGMILFVVYFSLFWYFSWKYIRKN